MNRAVWAVVEAFVKAFPLPQGAPGAAHEENCRNWTRKLAKQLAFTFGPTWGHKSASPERPPSKDAVAFRDGSRFVGYDTMIGASTGAPRLADYPPTEHDLTGQHFIPVEPVDYLELGVEPPDGEEPTEHPPDDDLRELLDLLQGVRGDVGVIVQALEELRAEVVGLRGDLRVRPWAGRR